jgi:hypothetical protein
MAENRGQSSAIQVTASNGVTWTRHPDGSSTRQQLLNALDGIRGIYGDVARRWNWWEEGRRELEHDRHWRVLREWDNGAPQTTPEEAEAVAQTQLDDIDHRLEQDRLRRADLVADSYDEDRAATRLRLLRAESDAAFFGHVLDAPASPAQRDDAERRLSESRTAVDALRRELSDPDQVLDQHGYLPAERRERNPSSHTAFWRHPRLREWSTRDRRRFTALLKMPVPDPAAMYSECEAPAEWHDYDLSLRLFHPPPPTGSQAETISRLMPGWWERWPASTAYQIGHRWGGSSALPDFDGRQWISMLPPLLRALFAPATPKPRTKQRVPKPLTVISPGPIGEVMARLAAAQAEHPDAEIRKGNGGTWELWPT